MKSKLFWPLNKIAGLFSAHQSKSTEMPVLWDEKRSAIYSFLKNRPALINGDVPDLPDEELVNEKGGFGFAPGAMDGISLYHGAPEEDVDVSVLTKALARAANNPTRENLSALYRLLAAHDEVLRVADPLLVALREVDTLDRDSLDRIALWLATKSPDRNAVKFGILLLGDCALDKSLIDILFTLGLHDEFTLFAVVSLLKQAGPDEGELWLWQLAQRVHGWGRIHSVERLSASENPEIQKWLLLEGFKNSILYEYLALTCAVAGNLKSALQAKQVDDALLVAAAEILIALYPEGPVLGISGYDDGAEVIERFLTLLQKTPLADLNFLRATETIKTFVTDDTKNWEHLEQLGWSRAARDTSLASAAAIQKQSKWPEQICKDFQSDDDACFWLATAVAPLVNIDPWDAQFARQKANPAQDHWHALMQTQDRQRMAEVLTLARSQLDLAIIASGADTVTGFGDEYKMHRDLTAILQGLQNFPDMGDDLVQAGLQSPVVHNRHNALRVLMALEPANWPIETRAVLEKAVKAEPVEELRTDMEQALHS